MNLKEYNDSKKDLYGRFAETIKKILEISIVDRGGYHLQQIQSRAKDVSSLQEKLENRSIHEPNLDLNNIEEEIKDLAGCRIIFYYNNDVTKFINSSIIRDNFDWKKSKTFCHNNKCSDSANGQYTADHYVVKLKQARISLPEYKEFKGLWCEIQIHTILNHAWSETNHNILYKKPKISGFGEKLLNSINKKLTDIMEKYLIPAGYEFQKVQLDYSNLLRGKSLWDLDIIPKVKGNINNNELYDILKGYKEHLLPNFNNYEDELGNIIKLVETSFEESKKIVPVNIETPFGIMLGKSHLDVLDISLDIINFVRYQNIEITYKILVGFFSKIDNKEEEDKILSSINLLAKYNVKIMKKYGLFVQSFLISSLKKMSKKDICFFKVIVIKICMEVLNFQVEDESWTWNTFTIRQSTMPITDELCNIRNGALQILQNLYNLINSDVDKRSIIGALKQATKLSYNINYNDDLATVVGQNSYTIVNFFTSIIPKEQYEILQLMEDEVHFLSRRAKNIKGGAGLIKESEKLIESINKFYVALYINVEFEIYKTLLTGKLTFEDELDNDELTIEKKEKLCREKIKKYLNAINNKNFVEWERRILYCMQTQSKEWFAGFDLGFRYFGEFLRDLAKNKPKLTFKFVKAHENEAERFLWIIFIGLLQSNFKDKAILLLKQWIDDKKHLYCCAKLFERNICFTLGLDLTLLQEITDKAIKLCDIATLNEVLAAIVINYNHDNSLIVQDCFLPIVILLTELKNPKGIISLWYRKEYSAFAENLDVKIVDKILENLLFLKTIDSHAEDILIPIAKRFPEKVLKFFGNRLAKKDMESDYDPIPYDLDKLKEPLAKIPGKALDIVSGWYDGNYEFFIYRGAKLLHNIFPDFPKKFEETLLSLINSRIDRNIEIVIAVLRTYKTSKGEIFLHNICKILIKTLPNDSKWLSYIGIILLNSDAVCGEFGLVELYEQKKLEVKKWLEDPDIKIRTFTENYMAYLDEMINKEKRRAEEEIELRKHKYGE